MLQYYTIIVIVSKRDLKHGFRLIPDRGAIAHESDIEDIDDIQRR